MNGNRATKWLKTLGPFFSIYNVDLPFFFFFFGGSQTTGIPSPIDMHGAHTTSLLLGCTRRYTCKDKRQMKKKKERKRINFLPERIDKSTHTDARPPKERWLRSCLSLFPTTRRTLFFWGGTTLKDGRESYREDRIVHQLVCRWQI